jgi:hypothetical protein
MSRTTYSCASMQFNPVPYESSFFLSPFCAPFFFSFFSISFLFLTSFRPIFPLLRPFSHSSFYFNFISLQFIWPPLWSTDQSSWLQIQRSRGRFPALPDFLRSSGSETESAQPREGNWRATSMEKERLRSRKPKLTAVEIRCADHATPSIP